MLTQSEKDYLYQIIAGLIGEDPSIKSLKNQFNERTITAVEQMVAANKHCNASMKEFIADLVGSGATLSKGWVKMALKGKKKKITKSTFRGYGCIVATKARWRTEILTSAI
jgi:hypothetical protein